MPPATAGCYGSSIELEQTNSSQCQKGVNSMTPSQYQFLCLSGGVSHAAVVECLDCIGDERDILLKAGRLAYSRSIASLAGRISLTYKCSQSEQSTRLSSDSAARRAGNAGRTLTRRAVLVYRCDIARVFLDVGQPNSCRRAGR